MVAITVILNVKEFWKLNIFSLLFEELLSSYFLKFIFIKRFTFDYFVVVWSIIIVKLINLTYYYVDCSTIIIYALNFNKQY